MVPRGTGPPCTGQYSTYCPSSNGPPVLVPVYWPVKRVLVRRLYWSFVVLVPHGTGLPRGSDPPW